MNNLSVLIGTCDAYSSLWENFSICFDRYWQHHTQNIFVGETISVPDYVSTKFETILCGKDISWGRRMREGIKASEDYIFFILDDYFFHYSYSEQQLNTYVEDMELHAMNRLQISVSGYQKYVGVGNLKYDQIAPHSPYLISMQPSIWRKEFLMDTLDPRYSPWDFEKRGTGRIRNKEKGTYIDRSVPPVYFNAVRKGFKKSEGWEDFRKQQKLKDF